MFKKIPQDQVVRRTFQVNKEVKLTQDDVDVYQVHDVAGAYDADTAKRLTKGVNSAANIYHIVLDKPLSKKELDTIAGGTVLEEGPVPVEEINFTDDKNKREIGMRIHVNKPRIVRRLFAHYGFEVEKLDRVSFAGLTKKRLNRGQYRHLDAKEVGFLKMR